MDAASGGEAEEGFGEGGVVIAVVAVLGDADVVGVGAEVETEVGEGGGAPGGDVEGGLQEEGDEACFVGLVGGGVGGVADGGLEGVVAGFEADADDAIDAVFEVEVSPEPVFEDFAHVAGGMEVGGVGAEGEPVVGGTALGDGGGGKEDEKEGRACFHGSGWFLEFGFFFLA